MPTKKQPSKSMEKPAKKIAPKAATDLLVGYEEFLRDLKARIRSAQIKAALSVNRELIELYWEIGKGIVERQETAGWGDAVMERLSQDLKREFPGISGFSRSNLYLMRAFYLAYRNEPEFVQQLVGQIPWGHNQIIIERLKIPVEREWYIRQTIEYGWSRAVLEYHIETKLYQRQATAEKTTNFARALPPPQSNLAEQLLKDPYNFDFLTLAQDAHERELERGLTEKIRAFLLELGAGFAFLGNQYHLEVEGKDFYIDLLFYHYQLRCLFAIDLKMRDFEPADAGQMSFYLTALDELVKHPDDRPTIGLILCKSKRRTVVEYTLRDVNKPIGVSRYHVREALPPELAQALPSLEELERVLVEAEESLL